MISAPVLLAEAAALQEKLVALRRTIHRHAEVGFALPETANRVRQELRHIGLQPLACGRAGLTAEIGGKRPGRAILLRADMDALPLAEQAPLSFACSTGHMHACGHDLHTAMLVGAARLLKAHEADIAGTVKLMFQPAEETFEGARDMIEAGVLTARPLDAALMIHVMAAVPLPSGTILVPPPGVSAPAADQFTVQIQGKGSHGSMPHTGIDPLITAAHILLGLQEISARELAVGERAVLTVGTLHAGEAANVIPDTATLSGTLRTFDEDSRRRIMARSSEIVTSIARAYRAQATMNIDSSCPTLVNDAALSHEILPILQELLGKNRAVSAAALTQASGTSAAGSEDFAHVSHRIPALMLALAAGHPEQGFRYPLHHPLVQFDESVLSVGSAVYAYAALRWLETHPL